jgi:hypothetical protein
MGNVYSTRAKEIKSIKTNGLIRNAIYKFSDWLDGVRNHQERMYNAIRITPKSNSIDFRIIGANDIDQRVILLNDADQYAILTYNPNQQGGLRKILKTMEVTNYHYAITLGGFILNERESKLKSKQVRCENCKKWRIINLESARKVEKEEIDVICENLSDYHRGRCSCANPEDKVEGSTINDIRNYLGPMEFTTERKTNEQYKRGNFGKRDHWHRENDKLTRVHERTRRHLFDPMGDPIQIMELEQMLEPDEYLGERRQTLYRAQDAKKDKCIYDYWRSGHNNPFNFTWTGRTVFDIVRKEIDGDKPSSSGVVPLKRSRQPSGIPVEDAIPHRKQRKQNNANVEEFRLAEDDGMDDPLEEIQRMSQNKAKVTKRQRSQQELIEESLNESKRRKEDDPEMGFLLEEISCKNQGLYLDENLEIAMCEKEITREDEMKTEREYVVGNHGIMPIYKVQKELTKKQVNESMFDPGFRNALRKENKSLIDAGCFELVEEDEHDNPNKVPYRYVFTYKHEDPNDSEKITRSKARFVLKGFKDKRLNFGLLTDAPTVACNNIRTVLSHMRQRKWQPYSFDVPTAFLKGKQMSGEVYMEVPDSMKELFPNYGEFRKPIIKLKKCVYGLGDAPREWYLALTEFLTKIGLERSKLDPCVFYYYGYNEEGKKQKDDYFHKRLKRIKRRIEGQESHTLCDYIDPEIARNRVLKGAMCLHVDDTIFGGDKDFDREIIDKIKKEYDFKQINSAPLKFLGGIVKIRENGDFVLDYSHHIKGLNKLEIPKDLMPESFLSKTMTTAYRSNLGIAAYLSAHGHPLAAYEVNRCASGMASPRVRHALELNKLIHKLKKDQTYILYREIEDPHIGLYCDAGFGTSETGRSQSGKVTMLISNKLFKSNENARACCVLSWKSSTIKRVVHSTRAAETLSAVETLGLGELTQFIWYEMTGKKLPITLYTDCKSNTESLKKISAPKEKGITMGINEIKQFVEEGNRVVHCSTHAQCADPLTKVMTYRKDVPLRIACESGIVYEVNPIKDTGDRKIHRNKLHFWRTKNMNKLDNTVVTKENRLRNQPTTKVE